MSGSDVHWTPRILLLEDQEVNRLLVRTAVGRSTDPLLKAATLLEASTLAEARSVLTGGRVDLAVLDVRVPDGNGLDLARELAEQSDGQRPAIVVVSASVLPSERQAATDAGCDVFMGKPFRPAELMETLASLLRRSRARS
jgi:CheY-like chemotaxis protein